jgi:hypothetical protein
MVAKFDHRSALLVSEQTGFVAKKTVAITTNLHNSAIKGDGVAPEGPESDNQIQH